MEIKTFFDNWEEIFIGAMLQFPLYFVIGWWIIPVMIACGLLWRYGGAEGGNKIARRIGVPLIVCLSTFLVLKGWIVFLALPFMVWACPFSYGESSWLFKTVKALVKNQKKADFLTRGTTYIWYWAVYAVSLIF